MSKLINNLLILFIIFAVSAASFEGFFAKWTFRDTDKPIYSFESMYNGTAERPFVYRQLLIKTAKGIVNIMPDNLQVSIKDKLHQDNFIEDTFRQTDIKDDFIIEYYLIYFACFMCIFLSTLIWRQVLFDVIGSLTAGTLGALTFTLLFPYLETNGGYYYDCPELLMFALATFFAQHGYWLALILMTPLAEFSKESFLFFTVTLYPLLRAKLSVKKSALTIGTSILIAGLVYLWTAAHYANNGGGRVYFYLLENALGLLPVFYFIAIYFLYKKFQINKLYICALAVIPVIVKMYLAAQPFMQSFAMQFLLGVYDSFGHTYGVLSGEYAFFLHIIFIFWLIKNTWNDLNHVWKLQAKFALAVNLPLIIFFGLACELRNWSILYPAFIVMISIYIKKLLQNNY